MTQNHGYNTPQAGTTNWHRPLNDNFTQLDTDVIIKAPFAARPNDPTPDTWFLATDRKTIFHYDGTVWRTVGGVGTESNPVPTTAYLDALAVSNDIGQAPAISGFQGANLAIDGDGIVNVSPQGHESGLNADQLDGVEYSAIDSRISANRSDIDSRQSDVEKLQKDVKELQEKLDRVQDISLDNQLDIWNLQDDVEELQNQH